MQDPPTAQQNTGSPERRAEVVAGIRALADLIETNLDLPVPQSISAQHSIIGDLTSEGIALIRSAAGTLGVEPKIEPGRATAQRTIAEGGNWRDLIFFVRYTVFGSTEQADGGEQS